MCHENTIWDFRFLAMEITITKTSLKTSKKIIFLNTIKMTLN